MSDRFPDDFVFGVSTASYQIEGAAKEDGKGPSVWDIFSHTPGKIARGETGDVACDHYHRYREDVEIMRRAGLGAYRFSTAWARVQPKGKGAWNEKGLAFYDRLVDSLLEAGVDPWLCFFHWDLPQALQEKGGWANLDTAKRYTDYAVGVAERMAGRVSHFALFNEPNIHALMGHLLGVHAPGLAGGEAYAEAGHGMNVAQTLALEPVKAAAKEAKVGTVLAWTLMEPWDDQKEEDRQAATDAHDVLNDVWLTPMLKGGYGDGFGHRLLGAEGREGDLTPAAFDFIGINYYMRNYCRPGTDGLPDVQRTRGGVPLTAMGWEVYPQGIVTCCDDVKAAGYDGPLHITENGTAIEDRWDGRSEVVEDPGRTKYLETHLQACLDARAKGHDLGGYFAWTFTDNFEWAEGYRPRFGLVYNDFRTQRRVPKRSWLRFQEVMAERRL